MKTLEIKNVFNKIEKLNLNNSQKNRMLRLIQIRGSNKKNKVMNYLELKNHIQKTNANITNIVIGPNWNRLLFVDINTEV